MMRNKGIFINAVPMIKKQRNNFHFYERFCDMAEHYFDHKADTCDSVPFFSYMPQYDQMNRAQLKWYFYWRDHPEWNCIIRYINQDGQGTSAKLYDDWNQRGKTDDETIYYTINYEQFLILKSKAQEIEIQEIIFYITFII